MNREVVITGLGTVTALGNCPARLLTAIQAGERASSHPAPDCLPGVRIAPITDFNPESWISETKSIRMMSRDAQLAVAAATLALRDSGVDVGTTYAPEEIGLYGATGLAGIAMEEVSQLVTTSAGPDGTLDLQKFGATALRQVRPVLSFKILANMPLCFVSICLNLQGPNAIFNPWEEHGAQAIQAGADAIRRGRAKAALVGGADVKTHELGLLALKQQGIFDAGPLTVGEGSAFLVLEEDNSARARNARIYARLARTNSPANSLPTARETIGDLFAAAPAIQLAVASLWCAQSRSNVSALCDRAQRSFTLEAV